MATETDSESHLVIVSFRKYADTKGAVRYQEISAITGADLKGDSDGAVIGTLYVRKAAFEKIGKGVPLTLSVHIDT